MSLKKVLIRVRRIRQVAKDLLYWVFDKWLELNGWQDKQLEFVFSDLNLDDQAGEEAVAEIERLYTRACSSAVGKLCDDSDFNKDRNMIGVRIHEVIGGLSERLIQDEA